MRVRAAEADETWQRMPVRRWLFGAVTSIVPSGGPEVVEGRRGVMGDDGLGAAREHPSGPD